MKKLRQFIWAAVIIGSVLTPSATAAESFSVLLQKGIFAEETEGNLDAAIKIYQQITAEAATNRSVVAQAQYRLGVCYQKQGNKEQAISILNDLLKQFPAEAALGQKARELLAGLGQIPPSNITIRQLPLTAGEIYSVSPDGRLVAYNKASAYNNTIYDNNVAIYETATGKTWPVNKKNEDRWENVIFSPDGRLVAYHLTRAEDNSYATYVARIDGSEAKQVYEGNKNANVRLYDWSPDGGQLIVGIWEKNTRRVGSVGTLDIKTGTLKEIKRVTPFSTYRGHVCLSSNGRYLAYMAGAGTENQRKISVIDLESATETTLVEREVGNIVGWSPEDAKLLFSSSRTGTIGLWAITVREGKPSGDPELVKAKLGDISPLGLTRDGSLYYTEAKSSKDTDIYLATANFQTGEISGQPRRVMDRFLGAQSVPVWSKDGQKLMIRNFRQKLFVAVSMASGEQKEYPVSETSTMNLPPLPRYAWSPDGAFLLVLVQSGIATGNQGILRYELASGTTEMLVKTMNAQQIPSHRFFYPRFSPDGNSFYYARRDFLKGADERTDYKDSIIRRNLRSGKEEIVYVSPETLQMWCPYELSPDGERLAIAAFDQFIDQFKKRDFVFALKVRDVSGSETKELVRMAPRENVISLAWTPDGKRLVYTKVLPSRNQNQGEVGPTEVWATAVDSGQSVELKFSQPNIRDISIHPDGRQIAFSAGLPDESTVWVMEGLMPKPVAPTARTTNK